MSLLVARRGGARTLLAALSQAQQQIQSGRACSAASPAPGTIVEPADDAALEKAIASSPASVVNYTAAWCGPCKAMQAPQAALAKKFPSVVFLKVDIDAPSLAKSVQGVTAVPTYVVRKGGQVLETIQGARLELLQEAVEQAAAVAEK
jgi:thioredoxin 1